MTTASFTRFRHAVWVSVGLAIGYLLSSAAGVPTPARAEITEAPRREAFKDGGELNETVLREIAATLKRIETRVDRIETKLTPAPQNAGNKIPPAE